MQAEVIVGVGSNDRAEVHVPAALGALSALLEALEVSPVYRCPAVGYKGPPYWNLVCIGRTRLAPPALKQALQALERASGRPADLGPAQPRTLDLDILLYDAQAHPDVTPLPPHPDLLTQAYVLRPLADLRPRQRHPLTGQTFAEHWAALDSSLPMTRVNLPGHPSLYKAT